MPSRPVLHVIAGPNGAGKSTFHEVALRDRYPGAEFVNADLLAWQRLGRPARTATESAMGQDLAEARRLELMTAGRSLVTETTFSHPSKLALMREGRARGYELRLYHVNVRSVELSALRVASRVEDGGHPVPQDKIRQRYVRNQGLILEAARMADKAFVYDNSLRDQPHHFVLAMRDGGVVRLGVDIPAWARALYRDELARFAPERINRAAASFASAKQAVQKLLDADAKLFIARPGGRYSGSIVHRGGVHVVQQIGPRAAVAHFQERLQRSPEVGEHVRFVYPQSTDGPVVVESIQKQQPARATTPAELARAFRTLDPVDGARAHAELASAYAALEQAIKAARLESMEPDKRAQAHAAIRAAIAGQIERGVTIRIRPAVPVDAPTKPTPEPDRGR